MSILESVNGTNASNSHDPSPELFSNQGCVPGVGCSGTGLCKGQVGGGSNNRVEIVCMPKNNAKNTNPLIPHSKIFLNFHLLKLV